MSQLTILGAGSWGTALAIVLAPRYDRVRLWTHQPDLATRLARTHENDTYLPGFVFSNSIEPTNDPAYALHGAEVVLGVMPSRYAREVYTGMLPYFRPEMRFVSATKGIEKHTLLRLSEVLHEVLAPAFAPRIAVLSGPTFAREIARGAPAAVVISSENNDLAAEIQTAFSGPTLRLYRNADPIGVEIGAALKNVIAIAAGICQGLGLGSNALAALITRGLAEMTRLAVAMGGQPLTLAGLAGLGDLVLTCTGELSRNRRVGMELAKGRKLPDILADTKMVAEGVETTAAAMDLALKFGVEMPITIQMGAILQGGRSPQEALRELMDRALKPEIA